MMFRGKACFPKLINGNLMIKKKIILIYFTNLTLFSSNKHESNQFSRIFLANIVIIEFKPFLCNIRIIIIIIVIIIL